VLTFAQKQGMNAQIAQVQFVIIELWRPVRACLEAGLAALACILVNQGYAGLEILVDGKLWTSWNTWRVRAVHA
jgi:hypothetical protein